MVAQAVQREVAALHHHQGGGQLLRIEQGSQARAAAQMPLGVGLQAAPALRQRQTQTHRADHVVQRLARTQVHVHPAHGHQRYAGELRNLLHAQGVTRVLRAQVARQPQPNRGAVARFS